MYFKYYWKYSIPYIHVPSIRIRNWYAPRTIHISSLRACSAWASVFPFFECSFCIHSACALGTDVCTENARQEIMRTLSIHVRNWCECSSYASGTGEGTEHMRRSAVPSKLPEHMHQDLLHSAHPEHMHQFLKRLFSVSIKIQNLKRSLQNMLSIRVRNWCVHWASASGTAVHAHHAHQKSNDGKLPQKLK